MNNDQQEVLKLLIQEYTHNFEHDLAHGLYDQIIKTGIERVYFCMDRKYNTGQAALLYYKWT